MTWAQRLKRVFGIDIKMCGKCGGKVIAVRRCKEITLRSRQGRPKALDTSEGGGIDLTRWVLRL